MSEEDMQALRTVLLPVGPGHSARGLFASWPGLAYPWTAALSTGKKKKKSQKKILTALPTMAKRKPTRARDRPEPTNQKERKMDTKEMIAKAHMLARKTPGYRYNPEVLESIINTGVIPEGVTLATMGEQKVLRDGDDIISVSITDNKEIHRKPITQDIKEKMLIVYAVNASALPVTMGSLA
jgi:hypothetical protein